MVTNPKSLIIFVFLILIPLIAEIIKKKLDEYQEKTGKVFKFNTYEHVYVISFILIVVVYFIFVFLTWLSNLTI